MSTQADIITAAMGIASDAAEGKLSPADLEAQAVEECRSLFGTVTVDGPLFPLQVEVARAVLAANGIPVDELQEWLAVASSAP